MLSEQRTAVLQTPALLLALQSRAARAKPLDKSFLFFAILLLIRFLVEVSMDIRPLLQSADLRAYRSEQYATNAIGHHLTTVTRPNSRLREPLALTG